MEHTWIKTSFDLLVLAELHLQSIEPQEKFEIMRILFSGQTDKYMVSKEIEEKVKASVLIFTNKK